MSQIESRSFARPAPAASPFAQLRAFVEEEIARRDALDEDVLAPSQYWRDYNQYSSYIRRLTDEDLRFIRYHTWHLTGDRYDAYLSARASFKGAMTDEYEALLPRLAGFRPQEPSNGIGIDTAFGRLSSGLVRYATVLADLHELDLVPRRGRRQVLEIGGGYGGLALMALQFNPELSYLICDLEESLFVQGAYLIQHLGPERVRLVRGEGGDLAKLQPGQVYLLPQSRVAALERLRFETAVNQQSMQEMTPAQVERYCAILEKCADRFYSCNKARHGTVIVAEKGLIANLHEYLAKRFQVLWDSTDHVSPLARLCLRHKLVRKVVTPVIGTGFLPKGEALLRRFVYRTGAGVR